MHTVAEMYVDEPSRLPRILVVGHVHVAAWIQASGWSGPLSWEIKTWENERLFPPSGDLLVDRHPLPTDNQTPLFICPGSIGDHRHMGNEQFADYAMLDFEENEVIYHRVPYVSREDAIASILVPKHTDTNLRSDWWKSAEPLIKVILQER